MTAKASAVVLAALDQLPDGVVDSWFASLSAPAQARARAFRSHRRYRQFVAGRQLLATLLRQRLGIDPLISEQPSGRPCVAGANVHCSIAHSGSAVMAGFSVLAAIGVDIEQQRSRDFERLVTTYFHPDEQQVFATLDSGARQQWFYRAWTRKEACAKASGQGLTLKTLAAPEPDAGGRTAVSTAVFQGYATAVVHCSPMPVTLEPAFHKDGKIIGLQHIFLPYQDN